jgi:hypothetical protein
MAHQPRTAPATYHLCSYDVGTGDQRYTVYELRQNLTQEEYTRELLEFCLQTQNQPVDDLAEHLEEIREEGFSEWAYDDRLYMDPWVQNVTKQEYDVLSKYLNCR